MTTKHTLLFGYDAQLLPWVEKRIPWVTANPSMKTVGVADGDTADAKLLAVAVYHNFMAPMKVRGETWYNSVEMTFAASSPRFATRRTITNLLKIPFDQYKVEQVFVSIPSINKHAIEFVKGIGFTPRGTLSRFYSKSVHACVFGLHRNTFKSRDFLRGKRALVKCSRPQPHGQQERLDSAVA